MKVSLVFCGMLLGVLLVDHSDAKIVEINANRNVSSHGGLPFKNSSDERAGTSRAMSSGGYQNMYDRLLTMPMNSGAIISSQDLFKTPKHIVYSSNSQAVYPQQPLKDAVAWDRSVPGEAYGGTIYKILKAKQEKRKGYQYKKPNDGSLDASKTNPPSRPPAPPPTAPIMPPSPIIAAPAPLPLTTPSKPNNPLTILPASPPAGPTDTYLPPPSGMSVESLESGPPIDPDSPFTSYLPPSGPENTELKDIIPPGPPMNGPPMDIPFDFHGYENNHPHDHFPEYIFDHDHDHDHDHHDHYDHDHHDEPPPTTTPAPPPPPPPPKNDRVKDYRYNYYYLNQFLWYSPLYATIYFSFYLLIIILRGVGRHVVKYADQYTVRNFGATRSLQEMRFLSNEQATHKADVMAQFVMKQIDDFKQKYIG